MELEISNPDQLTDLDDFCPALIESMVKFATDPINQNQELVEAWNQYFRDHNLGWAEDPDGNLAVPTFQYIVYQWFSHLTWFQSGTSFYIIPDENLLLNSTEITIDSLARLINYGALDRPRYQFFEEILDFFAEQLTDLYLSWSGLAGEEN